MSSNFNSKKNDENYSTQFKELMAQVPTSVAVVAVSKANEVRACTISSFMSVDVSDPTIMFVLKNDSRTLEGILTEKVFSVNLLLSDQENLSRIYASIEKNSQIQNQIDWNTKEGEVPLLARSKSYMVCQEFSAIELHSATVVMARVIELEFHSQDNPLIYYARSYPKIIER